MAKDKGREQLEASSALARAPVAPAIRALHLEDSPSDAELVLRRLAADSLDVQCRVVADEIGFRTALADFSPQVILSDFSLRGFDGMSALEIAREVAPATPFIFVSGTIGEERAIEALKRGATDYVLKDNLRRLVPAIKSALRQAEIGLARELAEDMLRRSESRLQDIINTSRDWIWECDREGRFTFSSPSVEQVLGYSRHEILGRRASEYIDPADDLQLQATLADMPSGGADSSNPVTLRWRHRHGKTRWLERTMVALRETDGTWRGVRGIDRDVTLRMAQEVRIRRLNRAQRFLSGASESAMRIRDRDRLIREACRLAVSVGGYTRATIYMLPNEVAGTPPLVCSYGDTQDDGAKWLIKNRLPERNRAISQVLATAKPIVVNDVSDPANAAELGEKTALPEGLRSRIALPLCIDQSVIGVVELDAREPGVFGDAELALLKQVAANITFALQYLRSKESAEYLEYYDTLTGLPNQALYVTRVQNVLDSARKAGQSVAVTVIDIVDFGTVNDNLGRHVGDSLLRLVAERLTNAFGRSTAVSRLGDDKFSMIEIGPIDAEGVLAKRIADCFEAPFSLQSQELRVDARAGFVRFPEDGDDAEALLQQAKVALQQAKDTSTRCLRYSARMNETASQRFILTNQLRRVVAERGFTLHYQPKLNLRTGAVDGAEALLRWSTDTEPVPPAVFVPMLESLRLIDEVGSWVVVQAMTETAEWTPSADFRVAANVSPLQLNREEFAQALLDSIAELGGNPRRLELEVTESTLMADPRHSSVSLAKLRDAGVSIAIDDFGTGHSSLRLLAGLPVDVLKIDRSFVSDLVTNRNHRLIVQTTIRLAASLGMKTVAEGVETLEQLELLKALGCDAVQGYFVSRPVTAADLERWLTGETFGKLKRYAAGREKPPKETKRRSRRT
jgi:diguanylate cyclase (GGDEF)-like protein/PAS domain S-box-containing protein